MEVGMQCFQKEVDCLQELQQLQIAMIAVVFVVAKCTPKEMMKMHDCQTLAAVDCCGGAAA